MRPARPVHLAGAVLAFVARRLALTWLVGAAAAGLASCGPPDECGPRDDHCVGDVLMRCEPPCSEIGCSWMWVPTNCADTGQRCVNSALTGPLCALSAEPDPGCAERSGHCDGDSNITCEVYGLPSRSQDCAMQGARCFEVSGGAQCALSLTPDPLCAGASFARYCSGGALTECSSSGLATSRKNCDHGCAVGSSSEIAACTP